MASKAETVFAEKMDSLGIEWMYEPEKLQWEPPKRKYTPDFKVLCEDGTFFYVEYKGYLRPNDKVKMKAVKKQHPNVDIRFVFQNASKPIYKGSPTNYGMWAEKNGYLWAEGFMPEDWLKSATIIPMKEA
jgi:hypothetical protein